MKYKVKITDESGNVQQCSIMLGCHIGDKSASLGLALSYALGDPSKIYVMDTEFVKGLLEDISAAHIISASEALTPPTVTEFKPVIPEPQPEEAYEYPHMKYGLPRHYAVHFRVWESMKLKVKAIKTLNKIYHISWVGSMNYYGFDGEYNCGYSVTCFKNPVTILTVKEFLDITGEYFKRQKP